MFVGTIHCAYKAHANISIRPDVLWYIICHEIATCVKQNPKKYAHLFTSTPDKRRTLTIEVDNIAEDWSNVLNAFDTALRNNIKSNLVETFLPKFSTSDIASERAVLICFIDVVSEYFSYGMAVPCGIPEIRLEGKLEDWQLLLKSTLKISKLFPDLSAYFTALIQIEKRMVQTFQSKKVDQVFWSSIYNASSETENCETFYYSSGWITNFFAYDASGGITRLKSVFYTDTKSPEVSKSAFPKLVSAVNVNISNYKNQIMFTSGVLGVKQKLPKYYYDDKGYPVTQKVYLQPNLGYAVIEVQKEK